MERSCHPACEGILNIRGIPVHCTYLPRSCPPVDPSEVCPHHARTETCPHCATRALPASTIEIATGGEEAGVAYGQLTLLSPADGRVLTKELSGTVGPGARLLILGPNEEAKSALFRATAGTWETGSGRIVRPGDDHMLFVAERPYMPPGTLREVLTRAGREIPDARIFDALHALDLGPTLTRAGGLDVERRWDTILTLGEQKRIAFAQILLWEPRVVFLERPGAGLGAEQLDRALDRLAAMPLAVLAIAAPADARRFYDGVLTLKNDGGWQWSPLYAGS